MNSKQRRLEKYKMFTHANILGAMQGAGVNSYGWIWMQQSRAGGSEKLQNGNHQVCEGHVEARDVGGFN